MAGRNARPNMHDTPFVLFIGDSEAVRVPESLLPWRIDRCAIRGGSFQELKTLLAAWPERSGVYENVFILYGVADSRGRSVQPDIIESNTKDLEALASAKFKCSVSVISLESQLDVLKKPAYQSDPSHFNLLGYIDLFKQHHIPIIE